MNLDVIIVASAAAAIVGLSWSTNRMSRRFQRDVKSLAGLITARRDVEEFEELKRRLGGVIARLDALEEQNETMAAYIQHDHDLHTGALNGSSWTPYGEFAATYIRKAV